MINSFIICLIIQMRFFFGMHASTRCDSLIVSMIPRVSSLGIDIKCMPNRVSSLTSGKGIEIKEYIKLRTTLCTCIAF